MTQESQDAEPSKGKLIVYDEAKNPKSESNRKRKERDIEKSVNFRLDSIHVGPWKKTHVLHNGELIFKCSFKNYKFWWEVEEYSRKMKFLLAWEDTMAINFKSTSFGGVLQIMGKKMPTFYREVTAPGKHTKWMLSDQLPNGYPCNELLHQFLFEPRVYKNVELNIMEVATINESLKNLIWENHQLNKHRGIRIQEPQNPISFAQSRLEPGAFQMNNNSCSLSGAHNQSVRMANVDISNPNLDNKRFNSSKQIQDIASCSNPTFEAFAPNYMEDHQYIPASGAITQQRGQPSTPSHAMTSYPSCSNPQNPISFEQSGLERGAFDRSSFQSSQAFNNISCSGAHTKWRAQEDNQSSFKMDNVDYSNPNLSSYRQTDCQPSQTSTSPFRAYTQVPWTPKMLILYETMKRMKTFPN